MYEIIEKKFKGNHIYRKYKIYYFIYFFILIIIFNLLNIIFKINSWILAVVTFLFFVVSIFIFIYCKIKINYGTKALKKHGFITLLKVYFQESYSKVTESLIVTLKENNVNSKDKIKLLIDYYISKEPINTKSNFTNVIADFFVTIASIVVISYNDITNKLNIDIVINIIYYSSIATLVILIFTLMIKYIYKGIFSENEYYNSSLLDELTYIYMNYDYYKNKLN